MATEALEKEITMLTHERDALVAELHHGRESRWADIESHTLAMSC